MKPPDYLPHLPRTCTPARGKHPSFYLLPDAVRPEKVMDVDCPKRALLETLGMKSYTDTGTIGFPIRATAEKVAALFSVLADELTAVVKEFIEIGKA
jgi:creatinine amidohydrolase